MFFFTTSERFCPPMKNEVYFNKPQRLTQLIGANISVIVAGRRTGKTDSIAAPFVLRNMQRMPGSTGGIVVPTFKHGLTNTLPGLFAAWKRWGYIRGVHYVIGRRPPKTFARPIKRVVRIFPLPTTWKLLSRVSLRAGS